MRRISVVGCPGAGKTAFAQQLADRLDLPRRVVMTRLLRRTLRRVLAREELWNGNRERVTNLMSWDPHRSILRWGWTRYTPYRERYEAATNDPAWGHLRFVRLRTVREVARFLDATASTYGRASTAPPGRIARTGTGRTAS